MDEKNCGKQISDLREAKRKQRCRSPSNTYERDMNKFLTIIYHNINRLHEDKMPMRKSFSEPQHLELCGTQEPPIACIENSVSVVSRFGRRHSDFALPLPQSERSYGPKTFKRKVVFSDTVTEESNLPCG